MGWTSKDYREKASHTDWSLKQASDFLYDEFQKDGYYIKKWYLHKAQDDYDYNELYVIFEHPKGHNFIAVIIVTIKNNEILWKEMEESMGPCYYNCPVEFLDLFPAKGEYAVSWREQCRKNDIHLYEFKEDE